jgi:integrase/recombinase XerD
MQLPSKEIEVLTAEEIESLSRACDTSTALGRLDKMIVSLYYGAGLRRSEGLNLTLEDVDLDGRVIHVRNTKTKRDRLVPMIKPLMQDLREYLLHARPTLKAANKDSESPEANYLLLNTKGRKCSADRVSDRFRLTVEKCDSDTLRMKEPNLHRLRHSFASHLLEKGMRLDRIARVLGHQTTQSTAIYTHLKKNK